MSVFLGGLSILHDQNVLLWLTAPLLALAGVTMIARDHVFAGAALPHAGILGVVAATTAPALFGMQQLAWLSHDELKTATAVIFTTAAALAFRATAPRMRESMNVVFGWTILSTASASCLLVAHHERAAAELQDVITSGVLVAQPLYVLGFATALLATFWLVVFARKKIVLLTIDPLMAEAVGMRVALWTITLALALGIVVGLSLRATGLLYTFGCLVLAPLAARSACREIERMFWIAPVVAVAASFLGTTASARHGLPPAQLIVLVQCVLLVSASAMRRALDRSA